MARDILRGRKREALCAFAHGGEAREISLEKKGGRDIPVIDITTPHRGERDAARGGHLEGGWTVPIKGERGRKGSTKGQKLSTLTNRGTMSLMTRKDVTEPHTFYTPSGKISFTNAR